MTNNERSARSRSCIAEWQALRAQLQSGPTDEAVAKVLRDRQRELLTEIVDLNEPLIQSRANRFTRRCPDLETLLQEGKIALIEAVATMDLDRGSAFGTYAFWQIDSALYKLVRRGRGPARPPVHLFVERPRLIAAIARLSHRLGRRPFDDELLVELGWSAEFLGRVQAASKAGSPCGHNVEYLATGKRRSYSGLDMLRVEAGCKFDVEALNVALKKLRKRDREFVQAKAGLAPFEYPHTHAEIAAMFGVTKQRVFQILCPIMEHLRLVAHGRTEHSKQTVPRS